MAPRQNIAPDSTDPVAELIASHLATLDLAAATTDCPFVLSEADRLRRRVRWFEKNPWNAAGMLGPNGMAPQIAGLLTSARFHGVRGKVA